MIKSFKSRLVPIDANTPHRLCGSSVWQVRVFIFRNDPAEMQAVSSAFRIVRVDLCRFWVVVWVHGRRGQRRVADYRRHVLPGRSTPARFRRPTALPSADCDCVGCRQTTAGCGYQNQESSLDWTTFVSGKGIARTESKWRALKIVAAAVRSSVCAKRSI